MRRFAKTEKTADQDACEPEKAEGIHLVRERDGSDNVLADYTNRQMCFCPST